MGKHNIPSSKRKSKDIPIMRPDLTLWLALISSNYPCFDHIFMVPEMFKLSHKVVGPLV